MCVVTCSMLLLCDSFKGVGGSDMLRLYCKNDVDQQIRICCEIAEESKNNSCLQISFPFSIVLQLLKFSLDCNRTILTHCWSHKCSHRAAVFASVFLKLLVCKSLPFLLVFISWKPTDYT
jgi:hypothetical protein